MVLYLEEYLRLLKSECEVGRELSVVEMRRHRMEWDCHAIIEQVAFLLVMESSCLQNPSHPTPNRKARIGDNVIA